MNSINHDKFEQRLIDRLQDHEVTPPAHLWQGIEARVANATPASSRRKRPRAVWWITAATAAAACVMLYFLPSQQQQVPPMQPTIVAKTTEQPQLEPTKQQPQQETTAQHPTLFTVATTPRLVASIPHTTTDAVVAVTEPLDTATTTIAPTPAGNTELLAQENSASNGTTVMEAKQWQAPMDQELTTEIITPSARWSTTFYASGSTVSGTNVDYTYKGFIPYPAYMAPSSDGMASSSDDMASASSGEVVYGEPRRKVLHCKVPIHVGALARYHITPRWSVEAGIAFTHQEATITTTLNDVVENYEQTMRYVGVPVGVSYTIFNKERFKLYATARGSIEKCVQSSTTRPYTSIDRPMLYSMSMAPGMQVNITRNLGIFLEPSLSYNISGESVMPTRYDDMPWDFDLRMGITWTINPTK